VGTVRKKGRVPAIRGLPREEEREKKEKGDNFPAFPFEKIM